MCSVLLAHYCYHCCHGDTFIWKWQERTIIPSLCVRVWGSVCSVLQSFICTRVLLPRLQLGGALTQWQTRWPWQPLDQHRAIWPFRHISRAWIWCAFCVGNVRCADKSLPLEKHQNCSTYESIEHRVHTLRKLVILLVLLLVMGVQNQHRNWASREFWAKSDW